MIEIIFVRYYLKSKKLESAINFLTKCFRNDIGSINVINIGLDDVSIGDGFANVTIHHFESEMMDIGAYRFGLECLKVDKCSAILLLNDTLFTRHPYRYLLHNFKKADWTYGIKHPFLLGVVDETKSIYADNNSLVSGPFISTFCFMLNQASVNVFYQALLKASSQIYDSSFISFLDLHLSSSNNPYAWGKSLEQSILLKKRLCVCFERVLSRAIIEHDGFIIDVNSSIVNKFIYRILDRFSK